MLRFVRGLLALSLGSVVWGVAAAPAHADPYAVAVSTVSGVLFEDCADHPFTYAVDPPADAVAWHIELVIQAPDGTSGGSLYIYRGTGTGTGTGVDTEQFCAGTDMPGTYTVTGTYELTEKGLKTTNTAVTPFTFDMRLPQSTVEAKAADKTPKLGQRVKVKVKVQDERPSGTLFATDGAEVQLQRQKGTKWVAVSGTKRYTNSAGKALLRFRHSWKGKTSFRVVARVPALGDPKSSAFTLRGHR